MLEKTAFILCCIQVWLLYDCSLCRDAPIMIIGREFQDFNSVKTASAQTSKNIQWLLYAILSKLYSVCPRTAALTQWYQDSFAFDIYWPLQVAHTKFRLFSDPHPIINHLANLSFLRGKSHKIERNSMKGWLILPMIYMNHF